MKIKNVTILLLLLLLHECLVSQNFFSQFYSSPLTVNPSNTGKFLGDYRMGGVGRNEKNGLSQSSSKASFFCDMRILTSALPENDRFAIGLAAVSEKNIFDGIKNSYLLISLAYHKGLDEEGLQQLGIGFQANFAHRQIEPITLVFEDQIRNLAGNGFTGINTGQGKEINITYPDFNIGLDYSNFINRINLLTVGVSVFHTNRPYRIFNGGEFALSPQGCIQIGLDHIIDTRAKIYSTFILSSSSGNNIGDLLVSCMYQTKINESNYKISLGGAYRNNQLAGAAMSPGLALFYNNFSLNMSYDIPVFSQTTSQRGAMELGLIYIGRRHPKK